MDDFKVSTGYFISGVVVFWFCREIKYSIWCLGAPPDSQNFVEQNDEIKCLQISFAQMFFELYKMVIQIYCYDTVRAGTGGDEAGIWAGDLVGTCFFSLSKCLMLWIIFGQVNKSTNWKFLNSGQLKYHIRLNCQLLEIENIVNKDIVLTKILLLGVLSLWSTGKMNIFC